MNPNPTVVVDHLASLFTSTADSVARATGFVRRQSKLGGSEMARTLVFGWLHQPQATLEDLAQFATGLGVPISPQGIDQRFGPRTAAFFERLLQEAVFRMVCADPVAVPLLQRFAGGVYLLDSTSVTLPAFFADRFRGCGGEVGTGKAGLKVQVCLNLVDGRLTGPFLHPGCTNDRRLEPNLPPLSAGALRLTDLGFYSINSLKKLNEQKVYWLTRLTLVNRFRDLTGRSWKPVEFFAQQKADTVDVPIFLGGRRHCLPCRLIASRAPPAVINKRRERLKRLLRRRGKCTAPLKLDHQKAFLSSFCYSSSL
jgi:hypothetical protein